MDASDRFEQLLMNPEKENVRPKAAETTIKGISESELSELRKMLQDKLIIVEEDKEKKKPKIVP